METQESADFYIRKISREDKDPYGSELLKMMDYYNANNLRELTLLQVKEYYIKIYRGNTN